MPRPSNFEFTTGHEGSQVGGYTITCKAVAALKIGDHVFHSTDAAFAVNKGTTAATYANRIGIVVGGDKFGMNATTDPLDFGKEAAGVDGKVIVQVDGVAYALAEGNLTAGLLLTAGTSVAGALKTAGSIENAGVAAIALEAGANTKRLRVLLVRAIANVQLEVGS